MSYPLTDNSLTWFGSWPSFVPLGTVLGRSGAGMGPKVRVKEGALHPSAKMTHRLCRGLKPQQRFRVWCRRGGG